MVRRLFALCTIASIATLAGVGTAFADPSGFVSIGAGVLQRVLTSGALSESVDGYGGEGRASGTYQFTPVLGVQGDVVLGLDRLDNGLFEYDRSSIDLALHGFYRDPERFLIGTFAQFGRDTLSSGGPSSVSLDRTYFGGEAQFFVDSLTLYAQGGMQTLSYADIPAAPELDGLFGSLEARYFLTPDFRIDAHAGLSTLTDGVVPTTTATTLNAGVGAEYRFENLPVSLFATYDYYHTTYDYAPDFSIDDHRVMVGVKFGIGEDSLQDRDRNGSSLKPVRSVMFGGTN